MGDIGKLFGLQGRGADVLVMRDGTLFLLTLESEAAHAWVRENVDVPDYMWLGTSMVAVESSYAGDIVAGMAADGLEVK